MGAGGSAEAMKFSDGLILVGIGILCAGFIIHGWVGNIELDDEDEEGYVKTAHLLNGDKLTIDIESITDSEGKIVILQDTVEIERIDFQLSSGEDYSAPTFTSKEYDKYSVEITVSSGSVEADVDINRTLMLDFIIYPIGAAILLFGLQKRRNEMDVETIDAELELKE